MERHQAAEIRLALAVDGAEEAPVEAEQERGRTVLTERPQQQIVQRRARRQQHEVEPLQQVGDRREGRRCRRAADDLDNVDPGVAQEPLRAQQQPHRRCGLGDPEIVDVRQAEVGARAIERRVVREGVEPGVRPLGAHARRPGAIRPGGVDHGQPAVEREIGAGPRRHGWFRRPVASGAMIKGRRPPPVKPRSRSLGVLRPRATSC